MPGTEEILTCAFHRWSPGIGDPTAMGWFTVLVYGLAGLVAALVAIHAAFPATSLRRERVFWTLLSLALFALAVNKQLDLQSLATAIGRCVAQAQGWYAQRRAFQAEVILGLLVAMAVFSVLLWVLMRGTLRRTGVALVGFAFVLGFVAVRAVGFHHVDVILNLRVNDVRMNWVLELIGPMLILLSGLALLVRGGQKSRGHP
jgi:hypothetical protein